MSEFLPIYVGRTGDFADQPRIASKTPSRKSVWHETWDSSAPEKFHFQRPTNHTIKQLYRRIRERLRHERGTPEFLLAEAALREQVATMAAERDRELAEATLRSPCRKVLASLFERWSDLTLLVVDPRIPLDNNFAERKIRNPALVITISAMGGVVGRLAMMQFSIFAALEL